MSNILTITTCGIDTESEIQGNAAIVYNGATLYALTAGESKTLKTANTRCATDINIGNRTLQCGGMVMTSDVVCRLREVPTTAVITITGDGKGEASAVINGTEYKNNATVTVQLGTTITLKVWGTWLTPGKIYVNGTQVKSGSSATYDVTITQNSTIDFSQSSGTRGQVYFTG